MKNTQNTSPGANYLTEKSLRFFYLLIVAVCFLAYANTLPNNYGVDDHLVTNHNPVIEKGIGNLYEIFTTNYISENGIYLDYRPIVKASFALEYSLFGWNPHISHFINILMYALACCLILKILLSVFDKKYFPFLFSGVLLYAVHPMHTEVVASLKNRDEIFVQLFIFLSALFFLRYAETPNWKNFCLGLLFFLLSILSKITGIPFIAITPLMILIKKKDWKTAIIVLVSTALLTGVYYFTLIKTLPGLARPYEYVETPLPYIHDYSLKFGTALFSLLYYIELLVAPVQFSFYYGINFIELHSLFSLLPILSLFFYLALLGLALYFFKKNAFLSFAIFFYLFQISLSSNIIQPLPGIVGERVLFTASLGFCLLVAYLINNLGMKESPIVNTDNKKQGGKKIEPSGFSYNPNQLQLSIMAILLLFYGYETFARNAQWKDTITLFEADMPHLEKSAKANYMAAKEIRRLYRTDKDLTREKLATESAKAIRYYNQAIKAYPDYAVAMEELGMIYAIEQKNNSMAIPLFEKAFSIDSTLWRSATNLAMAFQMSKDTGEAIIWYEKALHAKSGNAKVLEELGKLYYLKGEKTKALACNDSLMRINPESYLPYYNYAIYYMLEHDTAGAVKYFEEDVRHGEKERFPYMFLIKYYLNKRDTANAVRIRNFVPRVSR